MASQDFQSADQIRADFSRAMSAMYRSEVPLYGDLLDIVGQVNRDFASTHPDAFGRASGDDLDRVAGERHGAIRLGKASELSMMRRVMAVMGMHAVGYYDLSVAGVPVHSTAFRPLSSTALARNPFRLFTSLLRLDLIEDAALRREAAEILDGREIYSQEVKRLVARFEAEGGLDRQAAGDFVGALLETFRWHGNAPVSRRQYARFHDAHRLIADVVCFGGPHINHLTPRTLDIDAAQAEMRRRGMRAKAVIEGPPRRHVPILLRQTSFQALEESIVFTGGETGAHSARFGEIEQRGVALTPSGRALYDRLLDEAREQAGSQDAAYAERLAALFRQFPDDEDRLRSEGLAYFRYSIAPQDARRYSASLRGATVGELMKSDILGCTPITYEDFLPVSAAGIFQSNLGGSEQRAYLAEAAISSFEQALGARVIDPFALYEEQQAASIREVQRVIA